MLSRKACNMLSRKACNRLYKELFNKCMELIVLETLNKESMHGMDINKYIGERFIPINESSLYSHLRRMRRDKLIETSEFSRTLRGPDRRKIPYRITEKGRERLEEQKGDFGSFADDMDRLFRYV